MINERILLGTLEEGTELTIEFTLKSNNEEKLYQFPTRIEQVSKGVVLLAPILINNAFLNLEKGIPQGITLELERENEKPLVFNRCKLVKATIANETFYAVDANTKGIELNRRTGVRVYIGRPCEATVGTHTTQKKAILKDLSLNGFALSSKESLQLVEGGYIRISYHDVNFNYYLTLFGEIVRIMEQNDGTKLYGCRFKKEYNGLSEYINLKQREELVRHSEFGIKRMDYTPYRHVKRQIY